MRTTTIVASLLLAAAPGCEDDADPGVERCIEFDPQACSPLFEPTYDRVFTQVLQPRCGLAGTACHAQPDAAGAKGGMLVTEADATFEALTTSGFVEPGDPSCSVMMVRLNSEDPATLMPPGVEPLDESTRCSIAQWIEAGAQR